MNINLLYKAIYYFRYDIINEDVDSRGCFEYNIGKCFMEVPKKEDINLDGILNIGEDIEWEYNLIEGRSIVSKGSSNERLETTDLNSNGILDSDDGMKK